MAIINRKPKDDEPRAGSGKPFARIDADSFDEAQVNKDRQRVMAAADRYHAQSKQRPSR